MRAVLDEHKEPLRKILNLKVGDTLMLDAPAGFAGGAEMRRCRSGVGASGVTGALAVRVEKPISVAATGRDETRRRTVQISIAPGTLKVCWR